MALIVVLVTTLDSASASAATTGIGETCVGASALAVQVPVGPSEHISAGQRLGNDGPRVVVVVATGVAAKGAQGIRSAVQGTRYPLHPKVQGQLGARGWTTGQIDEAIQSGQQVRAINKATGNPATRHIHPGTGQSVVVDDITGQVIHVGGPGFKYGPGSGDVP